MHCCSTLQCRLRGKFDTNGVVTALLEERLGGPLNLVLSAEVSIHRLLCPSIQGPVIDIPSSLFDTSNMNEDLLWRYMHIVY
jgi:hypothetical protein